MGGSDDCEVEVVERGDLGLVVAFGGWSEAGFDQPGGFEGRGNREIGAVAQQGGALAVVGFVAIGGSKEDAGVGEQHR